MTVQYTRSLTDVSFTQFLSVLFRWRGSVYKLLWKELGILLILYYALNLVYRYWLTQPHQRIFEAAVAYCSKRMDSINLTFVLGFYVTIVFQNWLDRFNSIPWPDTVANVLIAYLRHHNDERSRLMRRTIMRYLNLAYVMTMRTMSPPVKKRFPTLTDITRAGLMLPSEENILAELKTPYNKFLIPIVWASSVISRARSEQRISNDVSVCHLYYEINRYLMKLNALFLMDCVNIPLVYTQVVTLCTYIYFLFAVLGTQFVHSFGDDQAPDDFIYFPFGLVLQFLFYIGWEKVAEVIINPFGEDDDDFDINMYIDRNVQLSYLLVDEGSKEPPPLIKDAHWNQLYFALPEQYPGPLSNPAKSTDDDDENVTQGEQKHLKMAPDYHTPHHYETPFDDTLRNPFNEDVLMQYSLISLIWMNIRVTFKSLRQRAFGDLRLIAPRSRYVPGSMEEYLQEYELHLLTHQLRKMKEGLKVARRSIVRAAKEEKLRIRTAKRRAKMAVTSPRKSTVTKPEEETQQTPQPQKDELSSSDDDELSPPKRLSRRNQHDLEPHLKQ